VPEPPTDGERITFTQWERWNSRLRPFLMPRATRDLYQEVVGTPGVNRLGDVAQVSVGYVTGANAFFHMRPSEARRRGIAAKFLQPTVRNGRMLRASAITGTTVDGWIRRDDPVLLLRLQSGDVLPRSVARYLATPEAEAARGAYKCRTRDPWYAVPQVHVPDAFLSYMSGVTPAMVANNAGCVCTNSVHAVRLNGKMTVVELQQRWGDPLTALSCEIEGHPLGGGMLKIEPREAGRVLVQARTTRSQADLVCISDGTDAMRRWRHYA
jgi:hypothetical protein